MENEEKLNLENDSKPIDKDILDGLQLPKDGKACAMICGEPEVIEKLMHSILNMADVADDHGLREEADALAALIPDVKIMKAAQYEGFQNYWLANGRAFELAFKERLDAQKGEKSFHNAWIETLQDYMDSLLGPQTEYVGKSLKTAQYEGFQNYWLMNSRAFELAFKKKLESQGEKEKSFFKAWMETLEDYQPCEDRQDFLEEALTKTASMGTDDMALSVFAEADRRKVSIADLYCEWAECHKESLKGFLRMAANKNLAGETPAVSVYEALDYFASGKHAKETVRKIILIGQKIEDSLKKKAGVMDSLREIWWRIRSGIGDAWDLVTFRKGLASQHLNRLNAMGKWFTKKYDEMKAKLSSAPNASLDPAWINKAIGPYLEELRSLVQLVRTPGSAARLPEMPELFVGGEPNPEYYDDKLNGVNEDQFDLYMDRLADILFQVRSSVQEYDKSMKEGLVGTPSSSVMDNFDKMISNALVVLTSNLSHEFRGYSSTINFNQMVDEVKATPWPSKIDEASKNAGISQGRAMSAGSIGDATTDIMSNWLEIVNKYLNAILTEINNSTLPNNVKAKKIQQVEMIYRKKMAEISKRVSDLITEKFDLGGRP